MTRRVALVSGHFFPSNLVGAQRARLWAQYLPEFGWEPIVVAGHPESYEERPDPELMRLLAPQLRVIHAATLSTRPIRLVGDIGVRSFWGCYRALSALAAAREIDFIHVIIPSNFLGPVGRLVHRRYGLPYGIDYVDPWVNRWPGVERPFSRAWGSYHLAHWLEPWAVRDAALITGVAPGYVSGMLERNPEVAKNAELAYMPFGIAPEDFAPVRDMHRAPFLFDPGDGCFHMIYGGALLPAGLVVLDAFLSGLRVLRETAPGLAKRLRVHFTGTGTSPDDPKGYQVLPRARRLGVEEMVSENPHRIGYVDMLNHLMRSNAVLVLGSTEPHYSPSKVFQGMLSRRPVFALLHEQSTAVAIIRTAHAGRVTTLTEEELPAPEIIAAALRAFIEESATFDPDMVDRSGFEAFSARHSTRVLAEAIDRACERHRARSAPVSG